MLQATSTLSYHDDAMKYYVYISDAKVDMLLPQIPHQAKKQIATELKLDMKILSASRKTQETTEEDRLNRLKAVVTQIRAREKLGTIDRPAEYFEGTLPMRWGPFETDHIRLERRVGADWAVRETDSSIVYFAGSTETSLVALGGSSNHVVGRVGESNTREWSGSAGPVLLSLLLRDAVTNDRAAFDEDEYGGSLRMFMDLIDAKHPDGLDLLRGTMKRTFAKMIGPEQRLEFLAKRLVSGNRLILGTPIYVAMAD